MKSTRNNIAVNLRYLRSSSSMTQEEVAEKIGVSRQAVAKWENGESLRILSTVRLWQIYIMFL